MNFNNNYNKMIKQDKFNNKQMLMNNNQMRFN